MCSTEARRLRGPDGRLGNSTARGRDSEGVHWIGKKVGDVERTRGPFQAIKYRESEIQDIRGGQIVRNWLEKELIRGNRAKI